MTQIKDLTNDTIYDLIRFENKNSLGNQQYVVDDAGQERIVKIQDAQVL